MRKIKLIITGLITFSSSNVDREEIRTLTKTLQNSTIAEGRFFEERSTMNLTPEMLNMHKGSGNFGGGSNFGDSGNFNFGGNSGFPKTSDFSKSINPDHGEKPIFTKPSGVPFPVGQPDPKRKPDLCLVM